MIQHIQKDIVRTKAGQYVLVSTVHLPLYVGGQYETMVFPYDKAIEQVSSWLDLQCARANSAAEALGYHQAAIATWEATTEPYAQED